MVVIARESRRSNPTRGRSGESKPRRPMSITRRPAIEPQVTPRRPRPRVGVSVAYRAAFAPLTRRPRPLPGYTVRPGDAVPQGGTPLRDEL